MEVDSSQIAWTAGSPIYGPASIHEGRETVLLKILGDRRREGGGIAYLARFLRPADGGGSQSDARSLPLFSDRQTFTRSSGASQRYQQRNQGGAIRALIAVRLP